MPQASVTSRTVHFQDSVVIFWINLLSRVTETLNPAGRLVKRRDELRSGNSCSGTE